MPRREDPTFKIQEAVCIEVGISVKGKGPTKNRKSIETFLVRSIDWGGLVYPWQAEDELAVKVGPRR